MKQVYISINNPFLVSLLTDILNNLGYLPIILNSNKSRAEASNNNKLSSEIIFVEYSSLKESKLKLSNFNYIICFLTYGMSITNLLMPKEVNIIEFYNNITLPNIKNVLENIN